jgi:hypothetical protein
MHIDVKDGLVSDLPSIEGHAKAPSRDDAAAKWYQMLMSAGPHPDPARRPGYVVPEHLIHYSYRLAI